VTSDYQSFLEQKICLDSRHGFHVDPADIHPLLKPFQRDIVRWALAGGRRGIFAAFGLGKSLQQLEIMRQIGIREGGRQLIVAPLGVRQEFMIDAEKIGLKPTFIRRDSEVEDNGLFITNYESIRDGRLSVGHFNGVSLDEASVLRSYGSLTYQSFLTLFSEVPYRFVATATPSPNRLKELIHYAGFLGVLDTSQALTRFFQRDSTKANNLTIYPHMERAFWLWVNSWAIFLQKPSDLGYSDEGYDLPPLHVHFHKVRSDSKTRCDRRGQFKLVNDAALSLTDASKEKRASLDNRIAKMKEILDSIPNENCIIWHDQEVERLAIKKALPGVLDIHGSMDLEERENRVIGFSNGKFRLFASKPILSGSGCNFQRHCNTAIFLGIGFKFHDWIQAIHRIHRFLQTKPCHIHIIYADTETRILDVLKQKWVQHEELVENMTEIIKKYGLSHADMAEELKRSMGVKRIAVTGKHFIAANNDCVLETKSMDENSVDMVVTSIPFSNQYEYTPSYNDFGYTDNNDHFWNQMDFLTPHLLRVLRPGRIYACHTKDRILFGNVTQKGVPTVSPFHAEAIFHGQKHGFDYFGMITVVTDVVRENNQTYRLGWSEQCKDGTKMGVGSPEYILLFRKPQTDRTKGYADIPVEKDKSGYSRSKWQIDAHAFWRSSGDRILTADEMSKFGPDVLARVFTENSLKGVYDYEEHVRIGEELDLKGALPCTFMALAPGSHHPDVWHDVTRMRTLNGDQSRKGLALHVCPLQVDIVDRLINRYSNPGELVYDPFAGLMTVPYRAIKLGRKGRGVELNTGYFLDGVKYLRAAEQDVSAPSLLDFCNAENNDQNAQHDCA
jgi:DNA modification methylase